MSHHDSKQKGQDGKEIPAREDVVDPMTPSQAEGSREVVNAALGADTASDEPVKARQPDAHRTPGQAEGTEETVDAQLREEKRS